MDNVAGGSAVMIPFTGEGRARVYIGLFESQDDADAYSPADAGTRVTLPVANQFVVVLIDAGDATSAASGLMSGVLSAMDTAIGNAQ
jgi:hypothetical protein